MRLLKKLFGREGRLIIALLGLILPWATYSQNKPRDDQTNSRVRPRQVNQSSPNAGSNKDSTRAQLTPRQIVEKVFPSIVLINIFLLMLVIAKFFMELIIQRLLMK